jgi:alkylation response protein AidB-like acyl-CoA dehydrogenase
MDLEPTPDQLALVEELRRLLAARAPRPVLADRSLWDELGTMGILVLPVPEADGGVGLGWAEAALAFQELGRAGVAGPFVATAAATAAGLDDGITGLVPAGSPAFVEHLDLLDSLLVVGDDGIRRIPTPLDGARAVARPLDPLTPVHVLDGLPDGEDVGDAEAARIVTRHAGLLAAATQVGLASAAVARGTAYAGERHQFGRPIGSFQAVKHLLADGIVGVEVARAAVDAAAVMVDEAGDDAAITRAVASARVVASDAAAAATRACIQVHGGMGYTWEVDAHLFLKRVLVLDQTPSTPEHALGVVTGSIA